MSPEQYEELKRLVKDTVHEAISEAITDKFVNTFRKLDDLAEDVNTGFQDIADDRKDMAIVKTSQATVERLMREVLDIISNQTQRLTNTVEHKADEAMKNSAQAVADKVEPVIKSVLQTVKNGVELKQKKFWQFWK